MNPQKILIVEDDPDVQKLYVRFFELEKYDVKAANDGVAGLELVHSFMPDLIALDVMMPRKDGIAVLRELKADVSTRHIPVMMLTNLGDEETMKTCLELGAIAYMIKLDFTPTEVVSKVRYFLSTAPSQAHELSED